MRMCSSVLAVPRRDIALAPRQFVQKIDLGHAARPPALVDPQPVAPVLASASTGPQATISAARPPEIAAVGRVQGASKTSRWTRASPSASRLEMEVRECLVAVRDVEEAMQQMRPRHRAGEMLDLDLRLEIAGDQMRDVMERGGNAGHGVQAAGAAVLAGFVPRAARRPRLRRDRASPRPRRTA